MAFCKKCGNNLDNSSKFCKKCGNKVVYISEKTKKKFCRKCGTEIINGKFCKKCEHQTEHVKKEKVRTKIPIKSVSVSIGIIILILVSFFVYTHIGKTGRPLSSQDITQKPSFTEKLVKQAYCGNKVCESGEDSSKCCVDCGCPSGYSCDGAKCKKLAKCGNDILEEGETSENCCLDAGCPTGETCKNNVCVLLKPELKLFFSPKETHSVTYLKSKDGVGIGTLSLSNIGNDNARNTKVTITSKNGYFEKKVISVGTVSEGSSKTQNIILSYTNKILDFSDKGEINLDVKVEYYNSANQKDEDRDSYMVGVYGRNSLEPYREGYTSYVTPHHPIIRDFAVKSTSGLAAGMGGSDPIIQKLAARWLFESMKVYGIDYVNDVPSIGDYVQFPIETLKRRNGDCEDLAVLYASLLESIGMKSVLIGIPGHLFAGYIDSKGYLVPVETTSSDFDRALSIGLGEYKNNKEKSILKPSEYRRTYSEVLYGEKESIPLPDVDKKILKQDNGKTCKLSFTLSQGWIAKASVMFSNSGDTVGAGCAAIEVYNNDGNKLDEDLSCWTIYPDETKEIEYNLDISLGDVLDYYCYGH